MTATASTLDTRLVAEWNDLLARSGGDRVFASAAWKQTWQETLGAADRPEHFCIYEGDQLVALAPMTWTAPDTLAFDGGADISDYLDFITEAGREADLTPRLLDGLDALPWTRLRLDCLRGASPTPGLVQQWATARGYVCEVQQQSVCPLVHLQPDWESFLATLGKKDRHELRRKLRRLEAAGETELLLVDRAEDLPEAMTDFMRLLRLSDHHKAEFMTAEMETFFRQLAGRLFELGVLRLYRLRHNGVMVAAIICFDDGRDELMLYNSGFDPAYAWLSVGLLLKVYALQEAINHGKAVYNTLRGNERYKYDLGAIDTPLLQVIVTRPEPAR